MSSAVIVVPNWGRLSPDMEAETGCKYAAFIAIGGLPIYKHLLSHYRCDGARVRIVLLLAPDAPDLDIDPLEKDKIEVRRLTRSRSIGETVFAGLAEVAPGDAVIVHMADTLVDVDGVPTGDAVYVQSRSDLYRWTSVSVDPAGQVKITNDRRDTTNIGPRPVCVGLFSFNDGTHLFNVLARALEDNTPEREPLFVALENYSSSRPMDLRLVEHWMDCGHVDGYYESRLAYQNLRHFNTLSYDPGRGQVTKKSLDKEGLRKQVRWFKQVPDEAAPFLPRIYGSSDGLEPFITMELLSIPTLGDLFVTRRLPLGCWNDVVRAISCIQTAFSEKTVRNSLAPQLAHVVYVEKTLTRLEAFISAQPSCEGHFVCVSGERWSIRRVQQSLSLFVELSGLLALDELSPIHGDFCFSNLLYDPKVKLVKMIDPRGEFGVPGVFGDRRYDLAKLAHSYAGKYDFIVANQFRVNVDLDGLLHLDVQTDDYYTRVQSIFDAALLPEAKLRQQVYAVQALLFLGMLPLHSDAPRRQLAMLTTGLQLYAHSWNSRLQ